MSNGEIAVVTCTSTKGPFMIELYRDWSPNGYDRAVGLFEEGFYDHTHFYRVVPDFLVQFGINYDHDLMNVPPIPDDPKLNPPIPFEAGTVAFAGSGANSRTTQLFISYGPTTNLGAAEWETPVGKVVQGMEHVHALYSYGDMPPWGKGPDQSLIRTQGRHYIEQNFPLIDSFGTCQVRRSPLEERVHAMQLRAKEELKDEIKHEIMQELSSQAKGAAAAAGALRMAGTPLNVYVGLGVIAVVLVILIIIRLLKAPKKKEKESE